MVAIESKTLTHKSVHRMDVFNRFCSGLSHPVITENNHIIASVNVICYENRTMRHYSGEILLITHGFGVGHIRFSEGDKELFTEPVYELLESRNSEYCRGRSEQILVIENRDLGGNGIHRLELSEDVI
ncbi:MAG: hypothetical protein WKF87_08110 [Chryseolinea sp.]